MIESAQTPHQSPKPGSLPDDSCAVGHRDPTHPPFGWMDGAPSGLFRVFLLSCFRDESDETLPWRTQIHFQPVIKIPFGPSRA